MIHKTLFLCDINGTYKKNINNGITNEDEITKFLKELENLRLINNSPELLFSFVSSEKKDVVSYECQTFKFYNKNPNIKLGIQFFETGYIDDNGIVYNECEGKIFQILFYLKYIAEKYEIDAIYYADDTDFYHFMLDELLINSKLKSKLYSIIPKTKEGLEELTGMIKKYINNNTYNI